MSTLLLISSAIALPLFLALTFLSNDSVESETRSWRIAAKIGTVLSLLMAAALVVVGAVIFVKAMTFSARWSGMALALVPVTEGVRHSVLFFPLTSEAAVNQVPISYFVRAGGYCVVTLFLLVASFDESWWCLPFAGLTGWVAGMSMYFGRQFARFSRDDSSIAE